MNKQTEVYKNFQDALNNACGEISEAARLSPEIFEGDELKSILRELARLMGIIDDRILKRSVDDEE